MQVKNLARTAVMGVAALASASSFAFVDNMNFDGAYILGGVGYAGINDATFNNNYAEQTELDTFRAHGEFAWRGGFGAWVTDHMALEFNYFGIADIKESEVETRAPYAGAETKLESKDMMFFDVSAVGRCFLTEDFWGFARLGVALGSIKRELFLPDGETTLAEDDEAGWGAAFGIGAQYDFTEVFGVRVEASTVQALNNDDMYAATANLVLNFGELM